MALTKGYIERINEGLVKVLRTGLRDVSNEKQNESIFEILGLK